MTDEVLTERTQKDLTSPGSAYGKEPRPGHRRAAQFQGTQDSNPQRQTSVFSPSSEIGSDSRAASIRTLRYRQPIEIRTFTEADTDAVIGLWRATGLVHPTNDPLRDIARKVADSPWGFLVLTENRDIIGSVMEERSLYKNSRNISTDSPD